MTEPPEPILREPFQKRVHRWLRWFSGVSIATAVLAPPWGERFFLFAILLPFVHCPLLWAVLFIRSLPDPWMSPSHLYIKQTYPEIWKRLRPWGDLSHNSFTALAFLRGRYDDGSDPYLQIIKERGRRLNLLLLWPFALIPICWAIAIPLYFTLGFERAR